MGSSECHNLASTRTPVRITVGDYHGAAAATVAALAAQAGSSSSSSGGSGFRSTREFKAIDAALTKALGPKWQQQAAAAANKDAAVGG